MDSREEEQTKDREDLSLREAALKAAHALGWGLEVVHDLGRREEQQDRWLVQRLGKDHLLLAVADGMGGHADGAKAARVAIYRAASFLANYVVMQGGGRLRWDKALSAALDTAHAAVTQEVPGGGTTLTLLVLPHSGVSLEGWFGHVGDSMIWDMGAPERERCTERHGFGHRLFLHLGGRGLTTNGVLPHVGSTRAKEWALATDGLCPDKKEAPLWGAQPFAFSMPPLTTLAETLIVARVAGSTDNATGLRVWPLTDNDKKDKEAAEMGIINPPDAAPAQGVGGFEGRILVSKATVFRGALYRTVKGARHGQDWELRLWNGEGGRWKFLVGKDCLEQGEHPQVADLDIEQLNLQVLHPVLQRWDAQQMQTAGVSVVEADPFAVIAQAAEEALDPAAMRQDHVKAVGELVAVGVTEGRANRLVAGGVTLSRLRAGEVTLPLLLACDGIGAKTAQSLLEQFAPKPGVAEEPAAQPQATPPVVQALAEPQAAPPVVQAPAEPPVKSQAEPRGYRLLIGARPVKGVASVEFLDLVKPHLDAAAALPHKRDDGTRGPVADVLLVPYLGAAAALDDLLRNLPPFDGRWIVVNPTCPYWGKLQRPFLDRAELVIAGV